MEDRRRKRPTGSGGPSAEPPVRTGASGTRPVHDLDGTPDSSRYQAASQPSSHDTLGPLSATSLTSSRTQLPQPKVLIPRIRRPSEVALTEGSERPRVSHACETCRRRKVKCNGERPSCKHCLDLKVSCMYADGKRAQFKRDFARLVGRNKELEGLLHDLSLRVSSDDRMMIQSALELDRLAPDEGSIASSRQALSQKRSRTNSVSSDNGDEPHGEAIETGTTGSNNPLQVIKGNLNGDARSRAAGFIGKTSEVQWLRYLMLQVELEAEGEGDIEVSSFLASGALDRSNISSLRRSGDERHADALARIADKLEGISGFTYHLDDLSVLSIDQVDPYELPLKQVAGKLVRCYLETVHDTYPTIAVATFVRQFDELFEHPVGSGRRPNFSPKWCAILNLILAIGAKYSHLIRAPWQGDERDHMIYYTRARALGMNDDTIASHPDRQQIQIVALLTVYYTCTGHVNRAWNMCGIGKRYAITLGLHIRNELHARNEDANASDPAAEVGIRLWWSLYSLDSHLSILTGRPTFTPTESPSVPVPTPFAEDFALGSARSAYTVTSGELIPSGTLPPGISMGRPDEDVLQDAAVLCMPQTVAVHFWFSVKMAEMSQKVLSSIYSYGVSMKTWDSVQTEIGELDKELSQWRSSLPPAFGFSTDRGQTRPQRKQLIHSMFYYSTRLILTRPCLCRMERRINNQSASSKVFCKETAQACINSAKAIVDLIPDDPDPAWFSMTGSWWSHIHYLMQAASVIMLELMFRCCHRVGTVPELVTYVKKIIRWLRRMSSDDQSAERAWKSLLDIFKRVASTVNFDVSDLENELPSVASMYAAQSTGMGQGVSQLPYELPLGLSQPFVSQPLQYGGYQSLPGGFTNRNLDYDNPDFLQQAQGFPSYGDNTMPMEYLNQSQMDQLAPGMGYGFEPQSGQGHSAAQPDSQLAYSAQTTMQPSMAWNSEAILGPSSWEDWSRYPERTEGPAVPRQGVSHLDTGLKVGSELDSFRRKPSFGKHLPE